MVGVAYEKASEKYVFLILGLREQHEVQRKCSLIVLTSKILKTIQLSQKFPPQDERQAPDHFARSSRRPYDILDVP